METSHPRKYNEKARLNSPLMRGAQRMTFFYSMNGRTVESLSVYVRINGSEERIWSRYGNYLSSNWTKGCVALDFNGTYQVESFWLNDTAISLKLLIRSCVTNPLLIYLKLLIKEYRPSIIYYIHQARHIVFKWLEWYYDFFRCI